MVKKSFLKTGVYNTMDGTEYNHLWQDSGESSSSEEEPEETLDTDERLTQQEWEDLLWWTITSVLRIYNDGWTITSVLPIYIMMSILMKINNMMDK